MTGRALRRSQIVKLRVAILVSLAAIAVATFVVLSRPEKEAETTVARAGNTATGPASVSHRGILAAPGGNPATEGAVEGKPAPGPAVLGVSLTPPLATWIALGDRFGAGRDAGRYHAGLDFDVGHDQPIAVLASCGGKVSVSDTEDYGLQTTIACGPDVGVRYAFLGGVSVETSQGVEAGEPIGLTDPALGLLHFEIRYRGIPVDPEKYIQALMLPPPEAVVTPPPTVARPTQQAAPAPTATTASTATSTAGAGAPTKAAPASPTAIPTSTPTATATPTRTPTSTPTPRPIAQY